MIGTFDLSSIFNIILKKKSDYLFWEVGMQVYSLIIWKVYPFIPVIMFITLFYISSDNIYWLPTTISSYSSCPLLTGF